MRYIGIDYGKKRVGIALSDTEGKMAFPTAVLANDTTLMQRIDELCKQEQVGKIIIGHSLHSAGGENTIQSAINEFITDLTLQLGLPVDLEPEQYSTQEAIRFQGRTELTDASAAAVILNSYLAHVNPTHYHDDE